MPASRGTRARSSGQLATINPNAAGLDVGSTFHVVAVPADRDEQPVRTFRTFSGDLHRLADWLEATGITTVAMESTSVYWIPVFEILEARGFEVLLVNATYRRRQLDAWKAGEKSLIPLFVDVSANVRNQSAFHF